MHADLARANSVSLYRSICSACPGQFGNLLVMRHPINGKLLRVDRCILCGQLVRYLDDQIAGETFHEDPKFTRSEFIDLLDSGESVRDFRMIEDDVFSAWKHGVARRMIIQYKDTEERYGITYRIHPSEGIQEIDDPRPVTRVTRPSYEYL
jgi:hypothetical protein